MFSRYAAIHRLHILDDAGHCEGSCGVEGHQRADSIRQSFARLILVPKANLADKVFTSFEVRKV